MKHLSERLLVGIGYLLVGVGAILPPAAYALDHLDTLPAVAIALAVIAAGVGLVLLGDKIAADRTGQPLTDPLENSRSR